MPDLDQDVGASLYTGTSIQSAVGQTFTQLVNATLLSFSFYLNSINNDVNASFAAYLYLWDSTNVVPVGSPLYASEPITSPTVLPVGEGVITLMVPLCVNLYANTNYIIFLSTAGYWLDSNEGLFNIAGSTDVYAGGNLAFAMGVTNSTDSFTSGATWLLSTCGLCTKTLAISVNYI